MPPPGKNQGNVFVYNKSGSEIPAIRRTIPDGHASKNIRDLNGNPTEPTKIQTCKFLSIGSDSVLQSFCLRTTRKNAPSNSAFNAFGGKVSLRNWLLF